MLSKRYNMSFMAQQYCIYFLIIALIASIYPSYVTSALIIPPFKSSSLTIPFRSTIDLELTNNNINNNINIHYNTGIAYLGIDIQGDLPISSIVLGIWSSHDPSAILIESITLTKDPQKSTLWITRPLTEISSSGIYSCGGIITLSHKIDDNTMILYPVYLSTLGQSEHKEYSSTIRSSNRDGSRDSTINSYISLDYVSYNPQDSNQHSTMTHKSNSDKDKSSPSSSLSSSSSSLSHQIEASTSIISHSIHLHIANLAYNTVSLLLYTPKGIVISLPTSTSTSSPSLCTLTSINENGTIIATYPATITDLSENDGIQITPIPTATRMSNVVLSRGTSLDLYCHGAIIYDISSAPYQDDDVIIIEFEDVLDSNVQPIMVLYDESIRNIQQQIMFAGISNFITVVPPSHAKPQFREGSVLGQFSLQAFLFTPTILSQYYIQFDLFAYPQDAIDTISSTSIIHVSCLGLTPNTDHDEINNSNDDGNMMFQQYPREGSVSFSFTTDQWLFGKQIPLVDTLFISFVQLSKQCPDGILDIVITSRFIEVAGTDFNANNHNIGIIASLYRTTTTYNDDDNNGDDDSNHIDDDVSYYTPNMNGISYKNTQNDDNNTTSTSTNNTRMNNDDVSSSSSSLKANTVLLSRASAVSNIEYLQYSGHQESMFVARCYDGVSSLVTSIDTWLRPQGMKKLQQPRHLVQQQPQNNNHHQHSIMPHRSHLLYTGPRLVKQSSSSSSQQLYARSPSITRFSLDHFTVLLFQPYIQIRDLSQIPIDPEHSCTLTTRFNPPDGHEHTLDCTDVLLYSEQTSNDHVKSFDATFMVITPPARGDVSGSLSTGKTRLPLLPYHGIDNLRMRLSLILSSVGLGLTFILAIILICCAAPKRQPPHHNSMSESDQYIEENGLEVIPGTPTSSLSLSNNTTNRYLHLPEPDHGVHGHTTPQGSNSVIVPRNMNKKNHHHKKHTHTRDSSISMSIENKTISPIHQQHQSSSSLSSSHDNQSILSSASTPLYEPATNVSTYGSID